MTAVHMFSFEPDPSSRLLNAHLLIYLRSMRPIQTDSLPHSKL